VRPAGALLRPEPCPLLARAGQGKLTFETAHDGLVIRI